MGRGAYLCKFTRPRRLFRVGSKERQHAVPEKVAKSRTAASPMATTVLSAFVTHDVLHALNVSMYTKAMWKRKELGHYVL